MMHSSLLTLFFALFLSASVLASPTGSTSTHTLDQRKLKQATRDAIVSRARNPFRRQAATSCGTCSDCCPGYCRTSGQVDHAVYASTDLPQGFSRNSIPATRQTDLESCIRTCCRVTAPSTCDLVRYNANLAAGDNCQQYYRSGFTVLYPDEDTPGVTVVANRITCSANAESAENRACCNAPLIVA